MKTTKRKQLTKALGYDQQAASSKSTIVIAVIGLLSAVLVAGIANLDKFKDSGDETAQEVGYYEARAGVVDAALLNRQEKVQRSMESAKLAGQATIANHLGLVLNEIRKVETEVRDGHLKVVFMLKNGERLEASKQRLLINEQISRLNRILMGQHLTPFRRDEYKYAIRALVALRDYGTDPIPLYGQGRKDVELTCELRETFQAPIEDLTKEDVASDMLDESNGFDK
jgi:hypothetical protein